MESEFGAPLAESEVELMNDILEDVLPYISPKGREIIEHESFWEKKEGILLTKSIGDRDCVFVYRDGNVAKCGIEKAFFDGVIDFRKPLSCHLFPIRVVDFGGPVLRYEKFSECGAALDKGAETDETIFEFTREALERAFGVDWYRKNYLEIE